tara:strand:+ start:70 stop:573 length:504 start_codon:yes stop_codon:yes gene_type:complete
MALKKSSSTINISFNVSESAPNTLTSQVVQLPLDPLNNEVFVVQMVDLDPQSPDIIAGTSTVVETTISTIERTSVGSLADPNVMAIARRAILMDAGSVDGCPFTSDLPLMAAPQMDYLAIIATDDFFVNIEGFSNTNAKRVEGRIWGYRAKADAATYAALVQSELLS